MAENNSTNLGRRKASFGLQLELVQNINRDFK